MPAPKRPNASHSSQQTKKRRKTKGKATDLIIGAPSADDNRLQSDNNPSSSALSIRTLNTQHSLSSLCIRVFSKHFPRFVGESYWSSFTSKWLEVLPEPLLLRIFALLKVEHPGFLSHAVITTVRTPEPHSE